MKFRGLYDLFKESHVQRSRLQSIMQSAASLAFGIAMIVVWVLTTISAVRCPSRRTGIGTEIYSRKQGRMFIRYVPALAQGD
jgi:hypothetical protein